jgi:hypothetical protein
MCQIDFRPLKVRNHLDLLACRWLAIYLWKDFDEGYNYVLDLISIGGLNKKLWASKVVGVPISGISEPPTWESQDKMTFGCKSPHGQAHIIL